MRALRAGLDTSFPGAAPGTISGARPIRAAATLKTLAESRGNAMVKFDAPQAKAPQINPRRVSAVQAAQAPGFVPAAPRQVLGHPQARGRQAAVAILLLCGSLTACASTPEPKIITRTVNVPIAVKCAAPLTAEPIYSDTPESLRAAPDIFSRVQLLLAGRDQRGARIAELTAAISGCVG